MTLRIWPSSRCLPMSMYTEAMKAVSADTRPLPTAML